MDPAIVYIIDDDPSVRRALSRLVRSAGFHVQTFADATAFLALERQGGAECLVLDVRMPKLSGPELRDRLQKSGKLLPTIFMTAFPGRDLESLPQADIIDVLYKPFDASQLLEAIGRALKFGRAT